jgi:hypothetical protein
MLSRRRVLAAVLPSSLSAGCLSSFGQGTDRVELTIHESGTEVAGVVPEVGAAPEVVLRSDASEVVIVGEMYVGSSNCNRVVLDGVQWESETLTIRLGVGRQTDAPGSCTMDESADVYKITAQVEDDPPEVVVVENTKTGDRWEQRVLDPR